MAAPEDNKFAQKSDEPRESFIHMRVTREFKGRAIRAAQQAKQKLTEFCEEAIEEKITSPPHAAPPRPE